MAIIEHEPTIVEEELAEPFDVKEMDEEDRLILGAIEWYETHEHFRGWGDTTGSCILGSLIIQKGMEPGARNLGHLPKNILLRVARAMGFDTSKSPNGDAYVSMIISENDSIRGTKRNTVEILRKALLNK